MNVLSPESGNMSESVFYHAAGSNMLLQCTGKFVPNYMVSHLTSQYSWYMFVEQNMETLWDKRTTKLYWTPIAETLKVINDLLSIQSWN